MIRSTLTRASLVAALAAATLLGVTPAASATVVPIPMRILIYSDGGGFLVCGEGRSVSTVANVWQLRVTGNRSDGTVINNAIVSFQQTFDSCLYVSKNAALAGAVIGEITYTGVGIDVAGAFPGRISWGPVVGENTQDSGISR